MLAGYRNEIKWNNSIKLEWLTVAVVKLIWFVVENLSVVQFVSVLNARWNAIFSYL